MSNFCNNITYALVKVEWGLHFVRKDLFMGNKKLRRSRTNQNLTVFSLLAFLWEHWNVIAHCANPPATAERVRHHYGRLRCSPTTSYANDVLQHIARNPGLRTFLCLSTKCPEAFVVEAYDRFLSYNNFTIMSHCSLLVYLLCYKILLLWQNPLGVEGIFF